MPVIKTVACEVCGRQKQEANHWFVVRLAWQVAGHEHRFICEPFDPLKTPYDWTHFVCGADHAQVLFSRFLQGGKL